MCTPLNQSAEPSVTNAMFNVAVDYYAAGALDDAIAILQLLSLLVPEDQGVWLALAQVHDDFGQEDVAIALRGVGTGIQELS
jgi:hypothetical protein